MAASFPSPSTDSRDPPSSFPARKAEKASHRLDLLAQSILFITSALALFAVTAVWPDTPDGWIHLHRVRSLSEALAAGVLFPRWFPDFAFGYGYPVFNFYAPASYYPAALVRLLGVDLLAATRVSLALFYGLSGVAMFHLARLWVGLPASLVAAVLFLLFPYRLYDLFVRGALPEFSAFLWLPLLAYGCALLALRAAAARQRLWGALAATGLCWAALIITHNLTALMAGLTAFVIWLTLFVWAWRAARWRVFFRAALANLAAFLLGVLLSAWYSAPALLEAPWVGIGAEIGQGYLAHFASWQNLFTWRLPFAYPAAADPTVALPGPVVLVAGAGAALLFLPGERTRIPITLACLATLLFSLWLTTAGSVWLWTALEPLLGRLQFPWRWQTLAAPAAALLSSLIFAAATRRLSLRWALVAALGVSMCVGVYTLADLSFQPSPLTADDLTREQMWALDARYGQVGATWTGEFLPKWVTEQRWAIGREPPEPKLPEGGAPFLTTATLSEATYLGVVYRIEQAETASFAFHRFFYPAWQATVNGVVAPSAPVGSLALLSVATPAGVSFVRIDWSATLAVWVGRIATAVGWFTVFLLFWRRRQWLVVLWLAVGVLALVVASGVAVQRLPIQQTTVDFGAVRLAGLIAPPARAGAVALVELHWLALQPGGELTAFVHLLGRDGEIIAQYDSPLATSYTPASRLLPGEIFTARHQLALPADLAPGRYDVRIGIYPAGAPDQPLLPVNDDAPFVLREALEVTK